MTRYLVIIIPLLFLSCKEKTTIETEYLISDNTELIEIYKNDQLDRQNINLNSSTPIDWSIVSKRDHLRRERISQLLDSNKIHTSLDYHNAAMIFQHGEDSIAYGMAVKLMQKSIELDPKADKWLLAAAIDRNLLSRNKPQIYGTQYQKIGDNNPWSLREIDTAQISDSQRIEYGVETLAQQREKVKNMNKKELSDLIASGKSIDEIIAYIHSSNNKNSNYDLSENGINNFGYDLISNNKIYEALKVFKLNTELYPQAYNTYDSYGECLLLTGQKEKAIHAYKKSLELNAKNTNAKKIIENNKV
ncbi:hypothetical protein A9Q86_06875 [Flavobacteriales bacterium 33_180_T64]|nr:hypothetical protein A9Q86_06875 [Flavobacteriales bacterium 33_180_T64]